MKPIPAFAVPIILLSAEANGQVEVQEGELTPNDCCIQDFANDVEVFGGG